MTVDQKKRWNYEKRQVRQLQDRLGMRVDQHIVSAVAALRLLGINTTGSCAGHIHRPSVGPFVLFQSPQTKVLEHEARELGDTSHPRYKRLRQRAAKCNALEAAKLLPYLDAFYAMRTTPYTQRLIVQSFGPVAHRLICQGGELLRTTPLPERRRLLAVYRAEMEDFTNHLLNAVFSESAGSP